MSSPMNAASQWRQALVRQFVPVYADNPNVAAMLLGGSTARGHADRFSDIELGVFWHHAPSARERQAAAERIPGDLVTLYPHDPAEEVWCDDYMVSRAQPEQPRSGVLVEVVHYTTDFLERTFEAVLQYHATDALKQNLLAGIADGIALSNAELVGRWKERTALYPDALAVAVINRYALIDHYWRWEMWLGRGPNLTMLYTLFTQVQEHLLHVLLGLNRVYYFGFKWLEVVDEKLRYKPTDFMQRLNRVYQIAPADGARELAVLVEETYTLVEHHFPQIDVAWLRLVFRHQRPLWDTAPPYEV